MAANLDTSDITQWRSVLTLVVFILANSIIAIFPFQTPIFIPRALYDAAVAALVKMRVIPPRERPSLGASSDVKEHRHQFVRLGFPMGSTTAPLGGVLFLLATTAIGRSEVRAGTVGANNIVPLDIVAFSLTMGYVVSSIDATGLVRYLTFKVLKRYHRHGLRLFLYLYVISSVVGCFFGNDAIIQMGAMFLSYMVRMSANIQRPLAWIYSHFAIANIASAILVSSNTTNVAIAQAFKVGFAEYTANLVVPVVVAVLILPPFLIYIIFAEESLVRLRIEMHWLPEESMARRPVNPNIPFASGAVDDRARYQRLEEVMNPFLDRSSALVGISIMVAILVVLLALTAAGLNNVPVFWVTLPGASVMFCWDVVYGWIHRHETRDIARRGREEIQRSVMREQYERARPGGDDLPSSHGMTAAVIEGEAEVTSVPPTPASTSYKEGPPGNRTNGLHPVNNEPGVSKSEDEQSKREEECVAELRAPTGLSPTNVESPPKGETSSQDAREPSSQPETIRTTPLQDHIEMLERACFDVPETPHHGYGDRPTVASIMADGWHWAQETFPSASILVSRLPFSIAVFAIPTFILVQALVSSGWVAVLAHGWDNWTQRAGTVGAIGGMGFLSVILSNFAGTSIGATVLLSLVLQHWAQIHVSTGVPITERTYWGAVYALAIGVNYAAFSLTFSASLAGIGWRRDLGEKGVEVRRFEFARVNLPLIAFAMIVSCAVLVGEIYITRGEGPYSARA